MSEYGSVEQFVERIEKTVQKGGKCPAGVCCQDCLGTEKACSECVVARGEWTEAHAIMLQDSDLAQPAAIPISRLEATRAQV